MPHSIWIEVAQTLAVLVLLGVTAAAVLWWARRRGFATRRADSRLMLLERLALDSRRSLHLVRVADRVLLIGSGDQGALTLLGRFPVAAFPEAPTPPKPTPMALGRWLRRMPPEI